MPTNNISVTRVYEGGTQTVQIQAQNIRFIRPALSSDIVDFPTAQSRVYVDEKDIQGGQAGRDYVLCTDAPLTVSNNSEQTIALTVIEVGTSVLASSITMYYNADRIAVRSLRDNPNGSGTQFYTNSGLNLNRVVVSESVSTVQTLMAALKDSAGIPDPLLLKSDGTTAAPAAGFSSEPGLGFRRESSNSLAFTSNNLDVFRYDDEGVIFNLANRYKNGGVTASTTQTQAGATALVGENNLVTTCVNDGDSVRLPDAVAGLSVYVHNGDSTNTNILQIWPESGDNLGLGVDTSVYLSYRHGFLFQCISDGTWIASLTTTAMTSKAYTASTTQTQAGAQLANQVLNVINVVANANDAVRVPPLAQVASQGIIFYKNTGANTMGLWPSSGEDIGTGVDTVFPVTSGTTIMFAITTLGFQQIVL